MRSERSQYIWTHFTDSQCISNKCILHFAIIIIFSYILLSEFWRIDKLLFLYALQLTYLFSSIMPSKAYSHGDGVETGHILVSGTGREWCCMWWFGGGYGFGSDADGTGSGPLCVTACSSVKKWSQKCGATATCNFRASNESRTNVARLDSLCFPVIGRSSRHTLRSIPVATSSPFRLSSCPPLENMPLVCPAELFRTAVVHISKDIHCHLTRSDDISKHGLPEYRR